MCREAGVSYSGRQRQNGTEHHFPTVGHFGLPRETGVAVDVRQQTGDIPAPEHCERANAEIKVSRAFTIASHQKLPLLCFVVMTGVKVAYDAVCGKVNKLATSRFSSRQLRLSRYRTPEVK